MNKTITDLQALEPVFRSDIVVRFIDAMGDDKAVIEDARTSIRRAGDKFTVRSESRDISQREYDRIGDFLEYRHASVLRGCVLKVEVEAPIFVQRQLRTHWVGFSQNWAHGENDWLGFNDQSGKYARYRPEFWLPEEMRYEVEDFDPMNPTFERNETYDDLAHIKTMKHSYLSSWNHYLALIENGVAREVARSILPEGTYVAGRITANLNAWLGLMSLRIDNEKNQVKTSPQKEIQDFALKVEELISERWPAVFTWWEQFGRTRP